MSSEHPNKGSVPSFMKKVTKAEDEDDKFLRVAKLFITTQRLCNALMHGKVIRHCPIDATEHNVHIPKVEDYFGTAAIHAILLPPDRERLLQFVPNMFKTDFLLPDETHYKVKLNLMQILHFAGQQKLDVLAVSEIEQPMPPSILKAVSAIEQYHKAYEDENMQKSEAARRSYAIATEANSSFFRSHTLPECRKVAVEVCDAGPQMVDVEDMYEALGRNLPSVLWSKSTAESLHFGIDSCAGGKTVIVEANLSDEFIRAIVLLSMNVRCNIKSITAIG